MLFIIYGDHLPLATKLIHNIRIREDNHAHTHTYTCMLICTVHLHGALYLLFRRVYVLWTLLFQRHRADADDGKMCVCFFFSRFSLLFTLLFYATKCDGEFFFFIVWGSLARPVTQNDYEHVYIHIGTYII